MYSIEVKNLEQVTAAIASFPKKAGIHVNEAIRKTLVSIQRDATIEAPTDTGKLRGDWDLSYGYLTGTLRNRSQYAVFMEKGTRPHFPPLEAIAPWAHRHGIAPFLVARSIAKKGTKGRHFLEKAIDKNQSVANRFFQEALAKTIASI